jgi:Kef-type K+ transport system membrane component KefB
VSAIQVLIGLLVLAYIGSILVGGRAIRGYGLPSGSEYVALGFVVGPHALGLLDHSTIGAFEPLAQVGLGWSALIVGIDYGYVFERRVPARRLRSGILLTLLSAGVVGFAVAAVAYFALHWPGRDALLCGLALGAIGCETTRHAVRWVALRYGVGGALEELCADFADASEAPPLLLAAVLFALAPMGGRDISIPAWAGVAASFAVGAALGALIAALVRRELRPTETWGLLLGATLLAVGSLTRVGLSGFAATFSLGLALTALSRHRDELRHALTHTEHAVLLPMLLLAGAQIDLGVRPSWLVLAAVAFCARFLIKIFSGHLLGPAPAGRSLLGLGLMPAGAVTLLVGLACAYRFQDGIGPLALLAAVLNVLLGELVGPVSLRACLQRAGEIGDLPSAEEGTT